MGRPRNHREVPCQTCGKIIFIRPSEKKKKVCSMKCYPKGNQSVHWRGGRFIVNGYKVVFSPGHPRPKTGNYVYEHRLIMEKKLGRYLKPTEIVHHKNGDRLDNRLKNLEITNRADHNREHGFAEKMRETKKRKGENNGNYGR